MARKTSWTGTLARLARIGNTYQRQLLALAPSPPGTTVRKRKARGPKAAGGSGWHMASMVRGSPDAAATARVPRAVPNVGVTGTPAARRTPAVVVRANPARPRVRTPGVATGRHAALPPGPMPGEWLEGMAAGSAGVRRFKLYRPPGVAFGDALPLMVMLHGCGQSAGEFAQSTRMNLLARRERFFVLYPEQDRLANPHGCWNWYEGRFGTAGSEADLLLAMVDQVLTLYPADRQRVALAGLSAGAGMAALLAARHPTRFAAVAMHSGVGPGAAVSTATALSAMRGGRAPSLAAATEAALQTADAGGASPLPPMLVLQGLTDTVVAPSNAAAAAEAWAGAVGASGGAAQFSQTGSRLPMRVTSYARGARERVRLCEVAGLGHAWSGGASGQPFSDAKGPDASRLVWAFAKGHFPAG